jgi:antitoxin component HigA of HigAB toxin-antitoxin module
MDISAIKTHRDYRRALKEIEGLMAAKRGTAEGDRLDVLVTCRIADQAGCAARGIAARVPQRERSGGSRN